MKQHLQKLIPLLLVVFSLSKNTIEAGDLAKIMIVDKESVITGSFNFTGAAEEKNAENLLIIRSKELAKEYVRNWNEHRSHSAVYMGR